MVGIGRKAKGETGKQGLLIEALTGQQRLWSTSCPLSFLDHVVSNPRIVTQLVGLRDFAAHQSSDLLAIWQRGRAIAVGLILSFSQKFEFRQLDNDCGA
jgi:hypothetical protein